MKFSPHRIVTRARTAWSRDDHVPRQQNGAESNDRRDGAKDRPSKIASTTASVLKFKVATGGSEDSKKVDSPLFRRLPAELQENAAAQDHLWEYLNTLPIEEIGVPDYSPWLTRNMRDIKYRNLIYPLGKSLFVHLYPDMTDSRDYYMAIEPSLDPSLTGLMEQIDRRLVDYIDELKHASDAQERADILLQCLDRICWIKGSRRQGGRLQVTERQLQGLRYLMLRDKEGLGTIEPLINDPYIEDISCSGVGPLFLEHKIFGGLKARISFDTSDELDSYVIKISEKISRPVTVREPIIDAILPDGSRVNIVYGSDVSKRGSNFTIRKFNTTPMSILELIELGTLTYEMAAYISLMVEEGMSTFVSGETASGKTTFLNAISTFISPNAKIVSIEDTPELQVP